MNTSRVAGWGGVGRAEGSKLETFDIRDVLESICLFSELLVPHRKAKGSTHRCGNVPSCTSASVDHFKPIRAIHISRSRSRSVEMLGQI